MTELERLPVLTLLQTADSIQNPYASPKFGESQTEVKSLLKATMRLYRIMGWCGITYFLVLYLFMMISEYRAQGLEIWSTVAGTAWCGLFIAFFLYMIQTASSLGVEFDRTYRRARWLGIIVSAMFFPILTIPGILAVRRLERCRLQMQGSFPHVSIRACSGGTTTGS
jgi:hypothetical protein